MRLESRVAYETQWIRVLADTLRWPNGHTGVYSVVERDDYASVMPHENGGFWLVEQYRYTIGRRAWEFPQGGWPHTAVRGTALDLARNELREETGFLAARMTHLGRLQESYGFVRQAVDVFLAEDLTAGEPEREVTEQDMVHAWFSDAQITAMVRSGEIVDTTVLAAIALFRMRDEQA